ncbi:MAG TPA: serine hydrolase domain-containing protein [Gemmatimonadaceae bacterium]|jgi:CubicO group peptidase (beta-lactamase class C family)
MHSRIVFRSGFAVLISATLSVASRAADAQWLPRARPEDVGISSARLQELSDSLRATWIDAGRIPGLVVVVARHGKLAYLDTLGDMDVTKPMRPDALFHIASMSKPVTAAAVMQLVDRGQLHLTDPVSKYIPAFAHMKVVVGRDSTGIRVMNAVSHITIEQLLVHTSGLTYAGKRILDRSPTIADFADSLPSLPLAFEPGTDWRYSVASDLLGRVVEVASGTPFDLYLKQNVFQPLSMRETGFVVPESLDTRVVRMYARDAQRRLVPGGTIALPAHRPGATLFAGGQGLISTPADYLRFAQMLLNGGELNGHRVLERRSAQAMMTNHLPASVVKRVQEMISEWDIGTYGFGYGGAVRIDSLNPPGGRGTYEWGGVYSTTFWVDPKYDLVVMAWTQLNNGTSVFETRLDNDVHRLVYRAITDIVPH